MTSNSVSSKANFGHLVYDSGNEGSSGRRRIGTSATEIELFDDVPPSSGSTAARSTNFFPSRSQAFDRQQSPSISRTAFQPVSSSRREEPKPNVIYQDANDQQLGSAVDRLLEKYAPDATPHNLLNTSTSRRPIGQNATREETPKPTFQTSGPPSSTTSHNYSTIIRSAAGQVPQAQTQVNNNNGNPSGATAFNQQLQQQQQQQQPNGIYDSFHHVMPQPSVSQNPQQQRPAPSQPAPAPIRANTGNVSQVVPGVLYNLNDDPLHLLLERQKPAAAPSTPKQTQQPFTSTTFQPSYPFSGAEDPLTAMLNGLSQQYPSQANPTTTTNLNSGMPPAFDLGNLIKRVQQDYLREIQPFVSSVKFVEKDSEFGQGLGDVGFTTPVSVRKGFRKQADDMLRRSFGQQDRRRKESDSYTYEDDSDEDDEFTTSSLQTGARDQVASKESFSSITSVSSTSTDFQANPTQKTTSGTKKQMHNQGTSPPPVVNPTKVQPPSEQKPNPPAVIPRSLSKSSSDEKKSVTTTASRPTVTKMARRVPSDEHSSGSSDVDTDSDDDATSTAQYNEHTPAATKPTPISGADAIATTNVVVKPDEETARRRANESASTAQRSEDIHPTPPTIPPGSSNPYLPTTARSAAAVDSDTDTLAERSGSENASDSEDDKPVVSIPVPTAPSRTVPSSESVPTGPSRMVPSSGSAPTGPSRIVPSSASVQPASTPPTTARGTAPQPSSSTTQQIPPSTARGTGPQPSSSTTQQTPASGGATPRATTANTPNIPFVPVAQRNQPASTSQAPAASGPAQTGSTRFFASDADTKANRNRSDKDKPSIGTRLKSIKNIFRRS